MSLIDQLQTHWDRSDSAERAAYRRSLTTCLASVVVSLAAIFGVAACPDDFEYRTAVIVVLSLDVAAMAWHVVYDFDRWVCCYANAADARGEVRGATRYMWDAIERAQQDAMAKYTRTTRPVRYGGMTA